MKLTLGDLNHGPCLPHPTNTYTCGVTITPRISSNGKILVDIVLFM